MDDFFTVELTRVTKTFGQVVAAQAITGWNVDMDEILTVGH